MSLEALGALLTNVPASHALCAVQDVAVVVAPPRHWPAAQLEQPVSLLEVGAVLTYLPAEQVEKVAQAASKGVAQTPMFRRRALGNKEERAAKLRDLSSVASGKFPSGSSLASRVLAGRAVYHSTTW